MSEMPKRKHVDNPPWNPYRLLGLMFIITNVVSSILLGINWRRLGKPQWVMPSILATAGAILLGLVVFFVSLSMMPNADFAVVFFPGMTLILIGFGAMFTVAKMQNGAYEKWKNTSDMQYVYDHEYNFRRDALIGAGLVVGLGIMLFIMIRLDA